MKRWLCAWEQVAEMLNGNPMGGKRRSAHHYDIWCLKYLPKFKWDHLTEEIGALLKLHGAAAVPLTHSLLPASSLQPMSWTRGSHLHRNFQQFKDLNDVHIFIYSFINCVETLKHALEQSSATPLRVPDQNNNSVQVPVT